MNIQNIELTLMFSYSIHINIFAGEEKKEQYPF